MKYIYILLYIAWTDFQQQTAVKADFLNDFLDDSAQVCFVAKPDFLNDSLCWQA